MRCTFAFLHVENEISQKSFKNVPFTSIFILPWLSTRPKLWDLNYYSLNQRMHIILLKSQHTSSYTLQTLLAQCQGANNCTKEVA